MNGVQGVEGSNPFIPTRKQKPQGIYGNVGPFSVFERLRIRPCFRPEGRQVGKACPGGYGRAYELRLALRAISPGSGVRLCLSLSLVRHEGCGQQAHAACGPLSYEEAGSAPAGKVSTGRAPAGWRNGDLRSTALPFFAQKGGDSYFEKM